MNSAPDLFPLLSVLLCVLGILMFLAAGVTAGTLSRALSSLRITIEGFQEHDSSPVALECVKDGARSLDGRYTFSVAPETAILQTRGWGRTPFTQFLEGMSRSGRQEYVLFLVRPEGIDVFHTLRNVLVLRNDDVCTATAALPTPEVGSANQAAIRRLPKPIRRKLQLDGNRLSFSGPMSADERVVLHEGLDAGAGAAVDLLFEKSKKAVPCVDHGVELVPAEWKFERDAQGLVRLFPEAR
jgi:hypothetical protein